MPLLLLRNVIFCRRKTTARYKGTSPAVTKGLVIGVPLSELEAGESEFALKELGTSKVSSDSRDEVEVLTQGLYHYLTSIE